MGDSLALLIRPSFYCINCQELSILDSLRIIYHLILQVVTNAASFDSQHLFNLQTRTLPIDKSSASTRSTISLLQQNTPRKLQVPPKTGIDELKAILKFLMQVDN